MKIKTTENLIEETAVNLLRLAVVRLPQDVKDALQRAHREEVSETGKIQLEAILKNIALAEKENVPLCQDTGIIAFHVKAGTQAKGLDKIESSLKNATRIATTEIPLRPNAVDPFTQKNSGDNTGRFVPIIYWELTQGDAIEITACPKAAAQRMFDSGMPEAMWVLQVEKFGPLTIAIDSHENNLFEEIRKKTEESRIKVYERLNIRFTV